MADFMFETKLPNTGTDLLGRIDRVDRERRGQPEWAELLPDRLEAFTRDGQQADFDTVEELTTWLSRRNESENSVVFLRWTEGGRSAGGGMRRIAIRLATDGQMWVGGQDEASAQGMNSLLEKALGQRLPDPPGPVPGTKTQAAQPSAPSPSPSAAAPIPAANRKVRGALEQPWVVGVGSAVVAGVILLWIAQRWLG